MRLHHLNCIASRPPAGRFIDGTRGRGHFANHCVLVETGEGLLLVDTGLGLGDVTDADRRLGGFFRSLLKPELRAEMTAVRQIERLGFRSSDVRDIVLTHLDFDRAGGLDDFPRARVHLLANERDAAFARKTWLEKQRYRPEQWSTRNRWIAYEASLHQHWFGLPCVRELAGLPPDILLVPLPGHTQGHTGVALRGNGRWMLHAGDAFFDPRELDAHPHCRTGLRAYQRIVETDRTARMRSLQRLRELRAAHPDIDVFCSSDVAAFERLAGHDADTPVEAAQARDPYIEKVVRTPIDRPKSKHAVPGIEVVDFDDDDDTPDPTSDLVPRQGHGEPRPRP